MPSGHSVIRNLEERKSKLSTIKIDYHKISLALLKRQSEINCLIDLQKFKIQHNVKNQFQQYIKKQGFNGIEDISAFNKIENSRDPVLKKIYHDANVAYLYDQRKIKYLTKTYRDELKGATDFYNQDKLKLEKELSEQQSKLDKYLIESNSQQTNYKSEMKEITDKILLFNTKFVETFNHLFHHKYDLTNVDNWPLHDFLDSAKNVQKTLNTNVITSFFNSSLRQTYLKQKEYDRLYGESSFKTQFSKLISMLEDYNSIRNDLYNSESEAEKFSNKINKKMNSINNEINNDKEFFNKRKRELNTYKNDIRTLTNKTESDYIHKEYHSELDVRIQEAQQKSNDIRKLKKSFSSIRDNQHKVEDIISNINSLESSIDKSIRKIKRHASANIPSHKIQPSLDSMDTMILSQNNIASTFLLMDLINNPILEASDMQAFNNSFQGDSFLSSYTDNAPIIDLGHVDIGNFDVNIPDMGNFDINIPNIDISVPDISIPDISIPDISMPDIGSSFDSGSSFDFGGGSFDSSSW